MIQNISWYQTGTNQWVSQMWIRLLIAKNCFFSSLSKMLRTQICGDISFDISPWSVYDVRGHRSEEICFWNDIDLGVTSEDTDLRGQGFERKWIWVWRNDRTRIWGKDTDLRPYTNLSLTYIVSPNQNH
jgi:hypothetical protein